MVRHFAEASQGGTPAVGQTGLLVQCTPEVRSGSKPAITAPQLGVCFDLQQRTLSIVFSVAP